MVAVACMSGRGEVGRFVRGFVVPLPMAPGGGGLLLAARAADSLALGIAGIGLIVVGLIWIVVSCVGNGIDVLDL